MVRSVSSLSLAYLTMCATLHSNFVVSQRDQPQAQQYQQSSTTPHDTSADGISAGQQLTAQYSCCCLPRCAPLDLLWRHGACLHLSKDLSATQL